MNAPYVPSPILPSFSYLEDTFGHLPYTILDVGIIEQILLRAHEGEAAADELLMSSPLYCLTDRPLEVAVLLSVSFRLRLMVILWLVLFILDVWKIMAENSQGARSDKRRRKAGASRACALP